MAYACSSSISPAHQLFAGLEGLLHGGSRTTDALAALSYFAEATMFAFEVFVFKTTTIEAAPPAIGGPLVLALVLMAGTLLEYEYDQVFHTHKQAKLKSK